MKMVTTFDTVDQNTYRLLDKNGNPALTISFGGEFAEKLSEKQKCYGAINAIEGFKDFLNGELGPQTNEAANTPGSCCGGGCGSKC